MRARSRPPHSRLTQEFCGKSMSVFDTMLLSRWHSPSRQLYYCSAMEPQGNSAQFFYTILIARVLLTQKKSLFEQDKAAHGCSWPRWTDLTLKQGMQTEQPHINNGKGHLMSSPHRCHVYILRGVGWLCSRVILNRHINSWVCRAQAAGCRLAE